MGRLEGVMQTPKLQGKWMLTGYQQGKGRVFGTVRSRPARRLKSSSPRPEIEYAATGATLSRTGKSVVYTGYSWRGRSMGGKAEPTSADPGSNLPSGVRRCSSHATAIRLTPLVLGRLQEFGIDAHLARIGRSRCLQAPVCSPAVPLDRRVQGLRRQIFHGPENRRTSNTVRESTVKRIVKRRRRR